ncbi:MAG: N-acetylmuramoyl-L-alanine amidase [Chthoniobacterales bacterium]
MRLTSPSRTSVKTIPSLKNVLCLFLAFAGFCALIFSFGGCASHGEFGPGAGHFHTVIVDAGHGGHDQGGRSRRGKNEKILTLDVALRLKRELERKGFHVILTRNSDHLIPLQKRVDIAKRYRNSIFVSIHYNHANRAGARGIETYYYSRKSKRLAYHVQQELMRVFRTPNRGVKTARFYVLRNNTRPAILAELGFLSNTTDNRYVQSSRVRQRQAEAIARGILAESHGKRP